MGAEARREDPFGLCGQVLDGQFRVDDVVGEGGFSVVYKGFHLGLDEPIAVKCLKLPKALGSAIVESFVRRFRDESRLHYRLSQGNLYIARSIASGTTMAPVTGALVPYMVLEWLEGKSLAEDFAERRARGMHGRVLEEVVRLLDPALDAIAYAHAQGVVHRDLNPGNLFLAEPRGGGAPRMKVLDFGVAKVVSDHAMEMGPRAQTLGHIRIFSPAYGAPEQFDDAVGKIGPWTDVYAIALILLEALRDATVNEGEHIGAFATRTLDPELRPTPRALGIPVGDEVEALLASAVAIAPAARPQDAGDLWGQLKHAMKRDAASGSAPHARRPESVLPRPSSIEETEAVPATSPVVEIVRTPAPGGGLRERTSTLRMSDAPPRPSEVLAELPPIAPTRGQVVTPAPPPPRPGEMESTPPPRPSLTPAYGAVWMRPQGSAPPPPDAPALPRSRAPLVALVVAVVLVLLASIALAVVYVVRVRAPRAVDAPATERPVAASPNGAAISVGPGAVAAEEALAVVDPSLASCAQPDGPHGAGRVVVTFAKDGAATAALVDPPFAGTQVGDCIAARYRAARTSPLPAAPLTVAHAFELRP